MDSFIDDLCERIRDHAARNAPLRIRGGGSKDFYGEQTLGEALETSAYSGIVAYEPKDLPASWLGNRFERGLHRDVI